MAYPSPFPSNDPGTCGKRISASSNTQEEGLSPVYQSKQTKQDSDSSASEERKKRRKKLPDEEVRYCEYLTMLYACCESKF